MKKWLMLQEQLQSRQQLDTGFFYAAHSSDNELMTNHVWTRDCTNIFRALDDEHQTKLLGGFYNLFQYNKELGKFRFNEFSPTKEWAHIHPIYNQELKERKEWAFIQNDSVGQFYQMLCKSPEFEKRDAYMFLKYLGHVNFPYCKDYGMWEEGPLEVRASSIAQCVRGIEMNEERYYPTKKSKRLKKAGYYNLKTILQNGETKRGRQADLALASVLYPADLSIKEINPELREKTTVLLESITRENGLIRYSGDKWDGNGWTRKEGNEMQWPMGLALMYMITDNPEHLDKIRNIYNKFDYIPEGILDGESNGTDLTEALAFYTLAEKHADELGH